MKYEDLKIGQKVKVVCSWPDNHDGWEDGWVVQMNKYVNNNKGYTISSFDKGGIKFLEDREWHFPWQSLELVGDNLKEINVTTTQVSVFRKGINPIFGEGVTHIRIEDEAAGPFIIISQNDDEIRLDEDEIQTVADAALKLLNDSRIILEKTNDKS